MTSVLPRDVSLADLLPASAAAPIGAVVAPPRHGTIARFDYWRCRCPACRDVFRYDRIARRAAGEKLHTVKVVGLRRRVNALRALGLSLEALSELTFLSVARLDMLSRGRVNQVRPEYAAEFHRFYESLVDMLQFTPTPEEAVRQAEINRWFPPEAWNDDTIDDRDAAPYAWFADEFDRVVVDRTIEFIRRNPIVGHRQKIRTPALWGGLSKPDRREIIRRLLNAGMTINRIGLNLGSRPLSVQTFMFGRGGFLTAGLWERTNRNARRELVRQAFTTEVAMPPSVFAAKVGQSEAELRAWLDSTWSWPTNTGRETPTTPPGCGEPERPACQDPQCFQWRRCRRCRAVLSPSEPERPACGDPRCFRWHRCGICRVAS